MGFRAQCHCYSFSIGNESSILCEKQSRTFTGINHHTCTGETLQNNNPYSRTSTGPSVVHGPAWSMVHLPSTMEHVWSIDHEPWSIVWSMVHTESSVCTNTHQHSDPIVVFYHDSMVHVHSPHGPWIMILCPDHGS